MMFNPVPKPQHKRRIKKRAERTKFSDQTYKAIGERDNWLCVRCSAIGSEIHHIEYRSSLAPDVSHKRNGCVLCYRCHKEVHESRELREWLRNWKATVLDDEGNYIF